MKYFDRKNGNEEKMTDVEDMRLSVIVCATVQLCMPSLEVTLTRF